MLLVRPVQLDDHAEILELAKEAGIGMTSLPPNGEVLQAKIEKSVASFVGDPSVEDAPHFLFALEDTAAKKLVGTTGIAAHVGTRNPFYSYKLSTIVQKSDELDIYSLQRVLHMVNDYTGATEIGSLFLLKAYRRDGIGPFLSHCRFLMLAQFPELFSDVVIAEMRGVQDEDGGSPFYKTLAQHFFQMEFQKADYINATKGGQFISDLMPKYPIYVNLLDPRAQAVIGKPLDASRPAMKILMSERFSHQGYIDVFDAGPTMQADREQIRTVADSTLGVVANVVSDDIDAPKKRMLANTTLSNFSMTMAMIRETTSGEIDITQDTADLLNLKKGDKVRYL